ncbi:MAG: sulfur carrier protein ThiS [Nitrospirae bacterium]|nr:sulfur carrier protein ThiS [Nitrospirota bacterium]
MQIKLNGEDFVIEGGATVAQLLHALDIQPQRVALEVNMYIVKRADYQTYEIKEGDTIEVVNLVGGG